MANLVADAIAQWKKSGPLISPSQIRSWARGVASRNLQLATLYGQPADMTAEKLVGQYYRMRGLCAESQIPLMHGSEKNSLAIELDHIVPLQRRKSITAAVNGLPSDADTGLAACMENVRLVCRFAHRLRHSAERSGIDLSLFCSKFAEADTQGCLFDPTIPLASQSSHEVLGKARDLMATAFADKSRFFGIEQAFEMLQDNHLPLTYEQARRLLREIAGGNLKTHERQFRMDVIADAIRNDDAFRSDLIRCGCTSSIVAALNDRFELVGLSRVTSVAMRGYITDLGIGIASQITATGKPRTKNAISSSARSSFWAFAKSQGIDGFTEADAQSHFHAWGKTVLSCVIEDAVSRNLVCRNLDRLFARVNRAEAAAILGLKPEVLKKYAVMGKAPPHLTGRPGSGLQSVYSLQDLYDWRVLYPAQNRRVGQRQPQLAGF